MSTTGSILKVYASATAFHLYGADRRFHTPVFGTGPLVAGTVQGDLVLVASGDFSMGLREQPDGSMAYAASGRQLVFGIMIRDVPFQTLDDVIQVITDAANISVAMYEAF